MTKSLMAAAALCAFAANAQATSNVTLYGILDQSMGWTSNTGGNSLINMKSGSLSGSRWGLRGTEDLGGGLKAVFVLESGFNVGTGKSEQGDRLFGRQAYVGLSSDQAGMVSFGRQYESVVDYVGPFGAGATWGGIARNPYDVNNLDSTHRVDNTLKYTSVNYNGFQFGGTVSPGGIAGSSGKNLVWSLGAGYNGGPLALGVAYLHSKDPLVSPLIDVAKGLDLPKSVIDGLVPYIRTAKGVNSQYKVLAAGGSYTFGAATLGATLSNVQYKLNGDYVPTAFETDLRANTAEVNLNYQLTPALLAGAGYNYTRIDNRNEGGGRAQFHQLTLGTSYAMSKRTDVYLVGAYQRASGQFNEQKNVFANINSLEASSQRNQSTVRVGLRHKF